MKVSNLKNKGQSKELLFILEGAIYAVSLFLILPAVKSDENTAQAPKSELASVNFKAVKANHRKS